MVPVIVRWKSPPPSPKLRAVSRAEKRSIHTKASPTGSCHEGLACGFCLMLAALSLACGYVPSVSLRTALPARRSGAPHVQLQLGEETRDVEETVFAKAWPDFRDVLVPTDTSDIRLESSVVVLPHPKKVKTGGEDASFARDGYYAVFDGVSGWARKGVDAGAFSRALAANTADALDLIRSSGYRAETVFDDLEMALDAGLADIELLGSTTACMLSISPDDRVANFLNVGDSGFHIFRPAEDDARSLQLVAKSTSQQHAHNHPFQLASWAAKMRVRDLPKDGERYTHELLPGDIILLSTDGVLDNLFDEQIRAILEQVRAEGGDVCSNIAAVIAERAREASLGKTEMTPWTVSLGATRGSPDGKLGGKVDDITVLAVQVPARAPEGGNRAVEPQEQLRRGQLPPNMVGRVVPNFITPRYVTPKEAWVEGRRGSLR